VPVDVDSGVTSLELGQVGLDSLEALLGRGDLDSGRVVTASTAIGLVQVQPYVMPVRLTDE